MYCGERGIRTPGGVTLNGFQDRRIRPLCHFSRKELSLNSGAKIQHFPYTTKKNLTFLHYFFTILFIKLIFNILQMDRKNILGKCFFIQK